MPRARLLAHASSGITPSSHCMLKLTAAIWWPEGATQAHNDIDLYLVDPNNVIRASSTGIPGVFEKARVAGSLTPGTWRVRMVRGSGGTASSQQVFFAYYFKESSQWPD